MVEDTMIELQRMGYNILLNYLRPGIHDTKIEVWHCYICHASKEHLARVVVIQTDEGPLTTQVNDYEFHGYSPVSPSGALRDALNKAGLSDLIKTNSK